MGEHILAVVVLPEARDKVAGGAAPLFIAANREEQNKLGLTLSRILEGMVHDLENGVYVIIRHPG